MRHLATIVTLPILLLFSTVCRAQHEQDNWYFGNRCHIQFDPVTREPSSINDSPLNTGEGSASISDPHTGTILLYTDGITVWNGARQIVNNGTGLRGHESSSQSALIVPMPKDSTKYYIFTADAGPYANPPNDGISYSVYDAKRNEITVKNVKLLAEATEKLVGIPHCNGRDYWVVVHGWSNTRFYAYQVGPWGIAPPVISEVGSLHGPAGENSIGCMKASPDGTRIACAIQGISRVNLLDFDNRTGVISRPIQIPAGKFAYGVSFSPNNQFLYTTGSNDAGISQLIQYDITRPDSAGTVSSAQVIGETEVVLGAMQIAPDGKIYVSAYGAKNPAVIGCPNNPGGACCYAESDPRLLLSGVLTLGMPDMIDGMHEAGTLHCPVPSAAFTADALTVCLGDVIDVTDMSTNATSWNWTFNGGTPARSSDRNPRIRFDVPGAAVITLVAGNAEGSDTAYLTVQVLPAPVAEAGPDRTICPGGSTQLSASGGVSFQWAPAEGLSCTDCYDPVASPAFTTTYHLAVTDAGGCHAVDSVTIFIGDSLSIDAGMSQAICPGDSVRLSASGADSYAWSPTTGLDCPTCPDPWAHPAVTTTYTLRGNRGQCSGSDTVTIFVNPLPAGISAGRDTAICAGGSARLTASGGVRYLWSPADGLSCADCAAPVAAPEATTSYVVTGFNPEGCPARDTVIVSILPAATVEIPPVPPICPGDSIDLVAHATQGGSYLWSPPAGLSCTDCPTPLAAPGVTTVYTLTVTNAGGCRADGSVTVTVLDRPAVDAGPDRTVCAGDSIRLGTPGSLAYHWEPAEGLDCPGCAQPLAAPRVTTVYHLTGVDAAGCFAVDSVMVTVPARSVLRHTPDTTICAGTAVILGAGGGTTYHWSPDQEVECPSCATTIVHPTASTTYYVDATDVNGCPLRDSVRVTLRQPVRAHIPGDLHARPGEMLDVPVMLDDPVADAGIRSLHVTIHVPGSVLLFREAVPGDALAGWASQIGTAPGVTDITLSAPPGTHPIKAGTLAVLRYATFIADTLAWPMPFDLIFDGASCREAITSAGAARLDSICGLSYRLIELTAARYALLGVRPNPFNPSAEISFSLGLDAPARLTVSDAAGRTVETLLDEYLTAGKHRVRWDAAQFPSGLYFYRIESGTWHAEGALLLVK